MIAFALTELPRRTAKLQSAERSQQLHVSLQDPNADPSTGRAPSHATTSARPGELWIASEHGAYHAKFTLTPSAQTVVWSFGLPPNTAHAAQHLF